MLVPSLFLGKYKAYSRVNPAYVNVPLIASSKVFVFNVVTLSLLKLNTPYLLQVTCQGFLLKSGLYRPV